MNFESLKSAGSLAVYKLGSVGYFFLIYFTDKVFYAASLGKKLYLHPDFEEQVELLVAATQFMVKEYKLPSIPLSEQQDFRLINPVRDLHPFETHPNGFAPVSLDFADPYLISLGLDTSNLHKELLTGSSRGREYTGILASNPEAQYFYKLNEERVVKDKLELSAEHLPTADLIKSGKFNLVYIVGPAGTGKSSLAALFAHHCKAPLVTYQGNEGVEKDDIVGASDVNTDEGAKTQFKIVHGLLMKAYIHGYQMVLDEGNFILPGVFSVINQMTDSTPSYTFKDITYPRHPNFILYVTANPGYEGTYLFNPATKTRGPVILIDKIDVDTFTQRMLKYCDNKLTKNFFVKLYQFADMIQETASKWGENASVGIRQAQILTTFILNESKNFDGFMYALKISYLYGSLSMDTENGVKIQSLVNNSSFISKAKELFSYYDYKVVTSTAPMYTLDDFISKDFTESATIEDVNISQSAIDDLFS
jgi:hypothetical protein